MGLLAGTYAPLPGRMAASCGIPHDQLRLEQHLCMVGVRALHERDQDLDAARARLTDGLADGGERGKKVL